MRRCSSDSLKSDAVSGHNAPIFDLEDFYEQEELYDAVSEAPDSLQPYYEGEFDD